MFSIEEPGPQAQTQAYKAIKNSLRGRVDQDPSTVHNPSISNLVSHCRKRLSAVILSWTGVTNYQMLSYLINITLMWIFHPPGYVL